MRVSRSDPLRALVCVMLKGKSVREKLSTLRFPRRTVVLSAKLGKSILVNRILFSFFLFRITCMHLPVRSKWLYVGSERGNIHIVHVETFALSGYIINWNKAIEV